MWIYHIVLTNTKTSFEKPTLTVVELQQLPDIEKLEPTEESSSLKPAI